MKGKGRIYLITPDGSPSLREYLDKIDKMEKQLEVLAKKKTLWQKIKGVFEY